MIPINADIAIPEDEIEERFIHGSGPGGQNVNKVAAAVQIRFDVRRSPSLPDPVRARLDRLAGRRLNRHGVLAITPPQELTAAELDDIDAARPRAAPAPLAPYLALLALILALASWLPAATSSAGGASDR